MSKKWSIGTERENFLTDKLKCLLVTLGALLFHYFLYSFGVRSSSIHSIILLSMIYSVFVGGLICGGISIIMTVFYCLIFSHGFGQQLVDSFKGNYMDMVIHLAMILIVLFVINLMRRRVLMEKKRILKGKDKMKKLLNNANDMIFVHRIRKNNQFGSFVEVNDTACTRLGYSKTELLLMGPQDIDIRGREIEQGDIHKTLVKDGSFTFETILITKKGLEIPVEINNHIFSMEGQKVGIAVARDITQRREVEKNIQKKREMINAILDATSDGILVLNHQREILHMNKRLKELLNIPESIANLKDSSNVIEYITSQCDSLNKARSLMESFNELTEESFKVITLKDGRIFEVFSKPLTLYDGDICKTWSFKEITKYIKTQIALREAQERYKKFIDFSLDGIFVHDGLKIKLSNASGARLLGAESQKELIGKDIFQFIHQNYRKEIIEEIKEAKTIGALAFEREAKYIKLDGTVVDVEATVTSIPFEGELDFLIIARDITKRKQSEKALQESEENYRRLVELLPDGVFVHNQDNVLFANQSGAKLLGAEKPNDLVGKWLGNFIESDGVQSVLSIFKQVSQIKGSSNPAEVRLIKLDGNIIDVEFVSSTFINKGETMFLTVARDISVRKNTVKLKKHIEENEKQLEEALEYDRIRTEFFANISHELRTPLNIIFSSLQLLNLLVKNKEPHCDRERIEKYIDIMKQNCFRQLRLVNNLIDITKIDAGYYHVHLENIDIIDIVRKITLSVKEYAEHKGILLKFQANKDKKVVGVDPDTMERIMMNLFSNAIKFTEAGGEIHVTVTDQGDKVRLSVRDTGIGIPEEKQKVIFERFRQVDQSIRRNHEGSGIGLALVKSLVEMQGGSIELFSKNEEGSEFIITLPGKSIEEKKHLTKMREKTRSSHIETINIEFSDIYS